MSEDGKRHYIRRELRSVVCPTCGKTFETYEREQKYCSPECFRRIVKRKEYGEICFLDEEWLQGMNNRIGRNIRNLRTAAGWSGKQVYHITGISQDTLYHWENGERSPDMGKLLWLCKKTGWKLSDILSRGT